MDTGWVAARATECEMHVTQLWSVFAKCRKQKLFLCQVAIFWLAATTRNKLYGRRVKQVLQRRVSTDVGFSSSNVHSLSVMLEE
jgi:hypothetical protein